MTTYIQKQEYINTELIYWKNQLPPEKGIKYTDPLFPPNKNSLLGLDSDNKPIDPVAYNDIPKNINPEEIIFSRASEIFKEKKYKLFSGLIEIDDVIQGEISDCYFLSSVTNLCKFPELILNLFKIKNVNEEGYYEIIFYIDGIKQIVIIDDFLPIYKNSQKPCFAQPHQNKIWVMLLEKAWAKINGGYANIIKGLPCEAFEFLTGVGSLSFNIKNKDLDDLNEYKYEIIKNVQIADKNKCFISCSTNNNENIEKVGLVKDHAYTLVDFNEIENNIGQNIYLFRLRNPWSKGEWNGDWSDKSNLWNENIKKQVKYNDKEDGIFFMNDNDFFKYFSRVEICNIFCNAKSITNCIEGEENIKNGVVFNIIIENNGILNVSVLRKNWRANRELRNKILPTHISIVKYNPNEKNKLKIFTDYNGTYESYQTCSINALVEKGNYLIYIYRDLDHAEFIYEKILNIKIICTSEFTHYQMNFDEREKGFPLLQNIILQAEFIENNYDPDKNEDFKVVANQIRGNGIGHIIYYISNPGYFLDYTGSLENVNNFIMLTPYLNKEENIFNKKISSGKYFVLLGMMNGCFGIYSFNCLKKAFLTKKKINEKYDNNDIDLSLFTDIRNNIKMNKLTESKRQPLVKTNTQFYTEVGEGRTKYYYSQLELKRDYGDLINLLKDIKCKNDNSNLKWGVIKGEYVIYIGQMTKEGIKQGKGLLINPKNIISGEFINGQLNGKGYTFNHNKIKLYYYNYIDGKRVGNQVTPQEEEKYKEIELKKEKERLEEIENKKIEELKKIEEEQIIKEKIIKDELEKIEMEEKKKLEETELTIKGDKNEIEIEKTIKLIKKESKLKIEKIKENENNFKHLMKVKTLEIKEEIKETKEQKQKTIEELNNIEKNKKSKENNKEKDDKKLRKNYFFLKFKTSKRKKIELPFEEEINDEECGCNCIMF